MTDPTPLECLAVYARQCDSDEFMRLIGPTDGGMTEFNMTEIMNSMSRSHDHARQMTAFAALGYVMTPKSVRRPQAVTTGIYTAFYMGLYRDHGAYASFLELLRQCVPDIDSFVIEAGAMMQLQMKHTDK